MKHLRKLETDLERGEKGVLKTGSLVETLRVTMSYPGLFAPACIKGRWLVDGGVVDPVPVGAARAMGAGVVIAVDLNSRIVSRNADLHPVVSIEKVQQPLRGGNKKNSELIEKILTFYERYEETIKEKSITHLNLHSRSSYTFDIIETIMTSISIMQGRITRMNLAVDSADILNQPRLGELKMMNFDQVEHAIEEGYLGVKEKLEDI